MLADHVHMHEFILICQYLTSLSAPKGLVLIDSAGDADSSRAPGLTSGLQGSVNVHRGALLLVPQWRCISSFVFYIIDNHENDHDDNDNHGEISRKCW